MIHATALQGLAKDSSIQSLVVALGGTTVNAINSYAEVLASVFTETDIVSYTVPANKTARISGWQVSSSPCARFKLQVDGVVNGLVRTSATKPTDEVTFNGGVLVATTGQIVKISGYHEDSESQNMNASIFGVYE